MLSSRSLFLSLPGTTSIYHAYIQADIYSFGVLMYEIMYLRTHYGNLCSIIKFDKKDDASGPDFIDAIQKKGNRNCVLIGRYVCVLWVYYNVRDSELTHTSISLANRMRVESTGSRPKSRQK